MTSNTATVTGYDAIEAKEKDFTVRLCKHADPVEDAREDITLEDARQIAREDAGLIYVG